jgi:hypothetical protein
MKILKLILLFVLLLPCVGAAQNLWLSGDTLFYIKPDSFNTSGGFDISGSIITDANDVFLAMVLDQTVTTGETWQVTTTTPYPIFKSSSAVGTGDFLKVNFGDSLVNYDGDGIKITDLDAIDILLDVTGGLELVDDSVNVKLDGTTLSLSSSGLAVSSTYMQTIEDSLEAGVYDSLLMGVVRISPVDSTIEVILNNTSTNPAIFIQNVGTGDAAIEFEGAIRDWIIGIDESASGDPFVIAQAPGLGTLPGLVVSGNAEEVGIGLFPTNGAELHLDGTFRIEEDGAGTEYWDVNVDVAGDLNIGDETNTNFLQIIDAGTKVILQPDSLRFESAADAWRHTWDFVDTPADNEVWTYDLATKTARWEVAPGAAGGAFDDAGDPIVQNTPGKKVNMGDGAGTLTGKVEIGNDADIPVLILEGHSTQTDDIFIIQQDDDTEVFTVSNAGAVTTGSWTATAIADAYVPNDITINSSALITSAIGFDAIGAVDLDIGSVDVTDVTIVTDGGTWIIDDTFTFPDANVAPNAVGELVYDNTVTGWDDGAMTWYDDDEVKYLVDLATLPSDDDYVVAYDAAIDKFYMKQDQDSGGATPWDNIGNPTNNGLTTITFDNAENSLLTGDNDAAVSFFTIQNTDADHTVGQMYLLHLDYSADDGDAEADFIKFEDSGSIVMTIQQDGEINTDGGVTAGGALSAASGSFGDGNVTNVGQIDVDLVDADGATITIGDNDETVVINSSDWDISATGVITNVALDADGAGNSITNIENADIKAAAGIVYSKLTFSNNIVAGDLAANSVANSEMADDAVGVAEMAHEDHGDVNWSGGTAVIDAGAVLWNEIGDPGNSGLTTITFDNAETTLLTGDNDAAASFLTIQNTDADHTGGNMYLLHLDYSADDGDVDADFIKLEDSGSIVMTVQQDGEIATDGGITAGGTISANDVRIADTYGLVIGSNAQVTVGNAGEAQILGTGSTDDNLIIGKWSTTVATAPNIRFVKSRNATIPNNTILLDNSHVGGLRWYPADGVDFSTLAAHFRAEVDDATPATGDIGMAFVWEQMPGGGGAIAETMRLSAGGALTVAAGVNLGTSQSLLGTTAMTIGDNSQTIAINSSDWDISATGIATGMGNITSNGTVEGATITEGGVAVYNDDEMDAFSELDAIVTDKSLVNMADGATWLGTHDYDGAVLEIPNTNADAALADSGQVHLNTSDGQLSFSMGTGTGSGELTGEIAMSLIRHIAVIIDPGTWYDADAEVFLFTVGDDYPEGIIIDEWKVSCNVDPDVEMDLDLKYADAFIGLANAAVIDVLDTTNGTSSEDTDANINAGAAVANGKVVYLSFGADPEGTAVQMIFEMWYHGEED